MMTDLEMTRLCAKAMKFRAHIGYRSLDGYWIVNPSQTDPRPAILYNPIHDDAQAMALVKKHYLLITPIFDRGLGKSWMVTNYRGEPDPTYGEKTLGGNTQDITLNRAICECVAKIQKDKRK